MRSDEERLRDILEAANGIAQRVARGRAHFDSDDDARLALTHLIEIVGEACVGISAELADQYPQVPWREISGMRNRVIHGYFEVDYGMVWTAAREEVPVLEKQVRSVLAALTGQESDSDGDE